MESKFNLHIFKSKPYPSEPDEGGTDKSTANRSEEPDFPEIINNIIHIKNIAVLRSNKIFRPPTDIYETGNSYIVKLEIAGVSPQEVSIEWNGEELLIRGNRREPTARKTTHYHQVEINYGEFEQIVQLPRRINVESSKAVYDDGFLVITIPKSNTARTRSVPIEDK